MEEGAGRNGGEEGLRVSGLGDRIRESRGARGWSLRELARRAGISHTHVAQIESGDVADPSVAKIVGIAGALGVPVESLLESGVQPGVPPPEPVPVLDRIQADLHAIQRLDPDGLEVVAAVTAVLRERVERCAKDIRRAGHKRKPTVR